jgi:GNAT superfamily N-acetyltransferase
MAQDQLSSDRFLFRPVTISEWTDFERFFSEIPASGCRTCWCMFWIKTRSEFSGHPEENRAAMKAIIESGRVPGILAYKGGQPVAWCAIAPRSELPGLDRSPTLKRIDDEPVWSITCFAIAQEYRGRGMTGVLVQEAIAWAAHNGARIVEAYPLISRENKRRTYGESYMGFASTFERLGFRQVSSRSRVRNIMRLVLPAPE